MKAAIVRLIELISLRRVRGQKPMYGTPSLRWWWTPWTYGFGRRALILASLLGLLVSACQTDGGCQVSGSGNMCIVGGPSALPSATPLPSPGATPDPCRVEAVRVGFNAGAQMPFIALGSTEQLDATPVNSSGEVPKGCNVAREPFWTDLTPTVCVHIGSGYNPFLKALRVGTCSVTANVANVVSPPFSVEVR